MACTNSGMLVYFSDLTLRRGSLTYLYITNISEESLCSFASLSSGVYYYAGFLNSDSSSFHSFSTFPSPLHSSCTYDANGLIEAISYLNNYPGCCFSSSSNGLPPLRVHISAISSMRMRCLSCVTTGLSWNKFWMFWSAVNFGRASYITRC